jgi:hypothetical protein
MWFSVRTIIDLQVRTMETIKKIVAHQVPTIAAVHPSHRIVDQHQFKDKIQEKIEIAHHSQRGNQNVVADMYKKIFNVHFFLLFWTHD